MAPIKILLLSLILLVLGVSGYILIDGLPFNYIFAHIGGLGIFGLLSCLAGFVANKKGYSYWKAFLICLISSIMSGIIAVGIVNGLGGRGCGGSVSLAIALIVIIFYSVARQKKDKNS